MAIVTDTVSVQRFAMGLFGVQVGTVTMAQVDKQIDRSSLGATLNSYYVSAFGAQTTAQVAATLVSNLGITGAGVADAVAYVTAKLNATAPAARGEEIASIINMFSGMTNDAVYGAAAKTWNANVDAAAAYAGTANVAFGSVIQQSLTEGMDVLFGSSLADQFNADLTAGGNTLQSGDRIDGGAGNDTLQAILGTNGDDTIKVNGSGDWKITAGEGDDTVYSDNSGSKAAWVFNTSDQAGAAAAGSARTLDNLKSSANTKYNLYKGVAEVTFRGLTSKVTFALKISEANLAYKGTTTREDFVLNIAGNAGNDKLTATIAKDNVTGDAAGWYANSKLNANLNINGGEGDDTITTKLAGDWKVVGGAGNDVIYDNQDDSENTFWLLNGEPGSGANINSGKNDKNFFAGVEVSVTFKHITKTVKVASTDGFTSDLQINQAIKDAVNNDATLKALLVAKDGPANSLIVESLVDGAVANDFNVEFARTSTLSDPDAATIGAAYRAAYLAMGINPNAIIPATSITPAQVIAVMDKHINDLGTTITTPFTSSTADIDFGSELGDYTGYSIEEVKAAGNQGDSTFNLGTGNDILALDVNMNSSDKVVYNAGELFGADTVVNFGTIVSATALETAAKEAETLAKTAETDAKALATAKPLDTALAAAAVAATAAATAATAAAAEATKSLTARASVDKFDFTAIGGDMMASDTINFVPGSSGGNLAWNFVNMSTPQADRALVDAGYGYTVGTFATVTTPASLNTATYFDAPTTGTNLNVTAASAGDLAIARKDKSIVIVNRDEVFGTEGSINDTAAEVALYVEGGVVETTTSTHVVVVVDKHNVGSVYAVVDGTAANDAVATLMGTIDLGSTLWSDLTAENFI